MRVKRRGTTDLPPQVCALCCFPGCFKKVAGQGRCRRHYRHWLREQETKRPGWYPHRLTLANRTHIERCLLANRVIDEKGCWLWPHYRNEQGYGMRSVGGREYGVHRLAAWLWKGLDLHGSLKALHRCDNPPCFNPGHLFLGDDADNHRDKTLKGRAAVKLNEHIVRRIRLLAEIGVSAYRIAKLANISNTCACRVINRQNWKHVL